MSEWKAKIEGAIDEWSNVIAQMTVDQNNIRTNIQLPKKPTGQDQPTCAVGERHGISSPGGGSLDAGTASRSGVVTWRRSVLQTVVLRQA